jgi:hypothetical protein
LPHIEPLRCSAPRNHLAEAAGANRNAGELFDRMIELFDVGVLLNVIPAQAGIQFVIGERVGFASDQV